MQSEKRNKWQKIKLFSGKNRCLLYYCISDGKNLGKRKIGLTIPWGGSRKKRGSERTADSKMSDVGYGNTVII